MADNPQCGLRSNILWFGCIKLDRIKEIAEITEYTNSLTNAMLIRRTGNEFWLIKGGTHTWR
jgi:hypothetical protein